MRVFKRLAAGALSAAIIFLLTACGSGNAVVPDSDNTPPQSASAAALAAKPEVISGFADVPADADYAQAVAWCKEKGLMAGVGDNRFDPEGVLTRATLATTLYRAAGEPGTDPRSHFTDAVKGEWYYDAVTWADAEGYMKGYGNNLFGTNNPVSVEQLEVILGRYTGSGPEWVGDPAKSHAATRAEVAVALYDNLKVDAPDASDGAAIILNMNGTDIHAKLYDNTAADAFLDLLPYTITVSRATDDLCGSVSEQLSHDPAEDQDTWAIGEIGWFDGWFTILCDNEAGMPKRTRTIIGKVDDADIPVLQAMTGSVKIEVTLDESQSDPAAGGSEVPSVYFTSAISPEGLMAVYEALKWTPTGNVAVKISTGESENSNHLRPELIKDLVQKVNGTIVECNTAYGGSRASTAAHKQAAADRGYTAIAAVDIMDEDGSMTLPVEGGDNLTENYVGAHFANYESFLVLSHFKGHTMAGFGGAIKNISIGIASSNGKSHIHSGGTGGSMWGGDQDAFLESMAEAGKSVVDALDGKIVYINVMNRLSVDCDCDGNPAEPDMHDIGILASYDPVALDQACVDLVYAAEDGDKLVQRIESRNGTHTLEQADKIGLGSREYQIVSIDNKEDTPVSEKINVTFNGHTYTATLEKNSTADAFVALIQKNGGSLTISASDYGGWEKVGSLGQALPRSDVQTTTSAGDFVLYSGDQIVLFYGSNSWSYTRLGRLDGDLSSLRADLGNGDVEVTYSLAQ